MKLGGSIIALFFAVIIFGFLYSFQSILQISCREESNNRDNFSRDIVNSSFDIEPIWNFKVSWIPDYGFVRHNNNVVFADTDCDQIVVINILDGETVWLYDVIRPRRITLDIGRQRLYVNGLHARKRLLSALAEDGQVIWSNNSLPARGATTQYILPNGDIYAFASPLGFVEINPDTGNFGQPISLPDLRPSLFYISHGFFWRITANQLEASNVETANIEWLSGYNELSQWPLKQVEVISEKVLLNAGSDLIALSQDNGEFVWSYNNTEIVSNIVTNDKLVVFMDIDAQIHLLNIETGDSLGTIQFTPPTEEARDIANGIGNSLITILDDYIVIYFADRNIVSAYKITL